ncbi:hypothetical protein GTP55_13420 [Duganella sp. FT109W]|uniref:Acid phosphatase n=1 Tax=Duganella margarita TaxID=2692170 RepID=A0ABW9WH74_9BURK|nr:hypothetical protein [Duganella margarita]MYN40376.1 hypothetical protein [Duganella margarita]
MCALRDWRCSNEKCCDLFERAEVDVAANPVVAIPGYLAALTLIEMVPDQRDAILARADAYAHNRLVCGVHYPSDIAASKLLAYTTHAVMETNPQYQAELAPARAELRRLLGLPAAE